MLTTTPHQLLDQLALLDVLAQATGGGGDSGGFADSLRSSFEFFAAGGFFMALLALTSLVAVMAIVFKSLTLRIHRVVPAALEREVEKIDEHLERGTVAMLDRDLSEGRSALARLCAVAVRNGGRSQGEVQEAVQSSAREEIVKMNSGLSLIDVVITIAPMLGLLGTASGLVVVFGNIGESAEQANIARGIARALNTTIVGLAIAVPAVVAHSIFNRKVERMAARLEVLLGQVVSACHQHQLGRQAASEEEGK
jgi:biopolymer transport protein ExbB